MASSRRQKQARPANSKKMKSVSSMKIRCSGRIRGLFLSILNCAAGPGRGLPEAGERIIGVVNVLFEPRAYVSGLRIFLSRSERGQRLEGRF